MILRDVLRFKGGVVFSISPQSTLSDVATKLVLHNCGSLLVTEGEQMLGIITERDLLRAYASQKGSLEQLTVRDFMTKDLITASPADEVEKIMGLMVEKRIRHMPVLDEGKLAGLISIGDVVKAHHTAVSVENEFLKNYIQS